MSVRRGQTAPDPIIPRPTTFEDGRALIFRTFKENKWDEDEIGRYFKAKETTADTPDGVEKILDAMRDSRMILFQSEERCTD